MYNCPQCGAGMRYDIASEKLTCDYCGYLCEPGEHPQQMKDAMTAVYEATLYTCPKCGGEIASSDHAATDFCPYCGSSVVLNGRLSNEQKPDYIVPFTRTKESCRSAFEDKAASAWCVPKDFKQGEFLDKMMGIYLPYHIYDISEDDRVYVDGQRTSGNYTEYCHINFDLKAEYPWVTVDASSRLDDDIAYETGSCDKYTAVDFSTAYLCGFYADTPDVDSEVYKSVAKELVRDDLYGQVTGRVNGLSNMRLTKTEYGPFSLEFGKTKSALFPFWFLTWRKDDRIAYGVMNGRTGKLALDLPVDIRKFLLFSLLFAVPSAFLYYLLPVMMPSTAVVLALVLMMVVACLYVKTVLRCSLRETHAVDKGREADNQNALSFEGGQVLEDLHIMHTVRKYAPLILFVVAFLVCLAFCMGLRVDVAVIGQCLVYVIAFLAIAAAYIAISWTFHANRLLKKAGVFLEGLVVAASLAVPAVIVIMHPVNDEVYYAGLFLILAGAVGSMLFIIRRFNMLCTRPIPVFHERKEAGQ